MRTGFFLFGALLCLLIVDQITAQCLCGAEGEDYCACGGPKRPFPKQIPRIADTNFPAIGDTCWCGKQLVEPALPPKPPCKPCSCKGAPPPPPSSPSCLDLVAKKLPAPGVPADPLSVSLALRAGKAFAVPEARLAYGPKVTPLNDRKCIYFSSVPEEKLYGLKSEIIELKRPTPPKDEIIEEEEEDEEVVEPASPYLTYQELGYGPAKFKDPLFIKQSVNLPLPLAPPPKVPDLSCGFRPGKIAVNAKLIDESHLYYDECM